MSVMNKPVDQAEEMVRQLWSRDRGEREQPCRAMIRVRVRRALVSVVGRTLGIYSGPCLYDMV